MSNYAPRQRRVEMNTNILDTQMLIENDITKKVCYSSTKY